MLEIPGFLIPELLYFYLFFLLILILFSFSYLKAVDGEVY